MFMYGKVLQPHDAEICIRITQIWRMFICRVYFRTSILPQFCLVPTLNSRGVGGCVHYLQKNIIATGMR